MNHSKDAILQGLTERIAVQVLRGNPLHHQTGATGTMPMSKSAKKKYLKALNRSLKKEAGKDFASSFVFYPPGAKPRDATGVTASEAANPQELKLMEAVQARVFAEFNSASGAA